MYSITLLASTPVFVTPLVGDDVAPTPDCISLIKSPKFVAFPRVAIVKKSIDPLAAEPGPPPKQIALVAFAHADDYCLT